MEWWNRCTVLTALGCAAKMVSLGTAEFQAEYANDFGFEREMSSSFAPGQFRGRKKEI